MNYLRTMAEIDPPTHPKTLTQQANCASYPAPMSDIPWRSLSSNGGFQALAVALVAVLPGGVLVEKGAGLEAAVQDADEPVRELPQGRVVADVPAAQRVVVGPRTRRSAQRAERLLVQRGAQAPVGGVPR